MLMEDVTDERIKEALEARARRAAKRVGLLARKSRRQFSIDNLGDFQLIDERERAYNSDVHGRIPPTQ